MKGTDTEHGMNTKAKMRMKPTEGCEAIKSMIVLGCVISENSIPFLLQSLCARIKCIRTKNWSFVVLVTVGGVWLMKKKQKTRRAEPPRSVAVLVWLLSCWEFIEDCQVASFSNQLKIIYPTINRSHQLGFPLWPLIGREMSQMTPRQHLDGNSQRRRKWSKEKKG